MDVHQRIKEMRRLRESGLTYAKIGRQFGVSRQRVEWLVHRDAYMKLHPKSPRQRAKDTYLRVYFVRGLDFVKIGIAVDIQARLRALRFACPLDLALLGTVGGGRKREAELHEQFKACRHVGEWFFATSELLDWIDKNASK